ncbi:MAG: InlB B-repeat-containing protein [Oscillospiraceae bacterium]|nr:InlB B-repeat-containing protein [Oscillospiraceae bacterium]
MKNRIIAIALCLLMLASMVPAGVFAQLGNNNYSRDVDKYARLNDYYAEGYILVHDGSSNFAMTEAMLFTYEEFDEDLILRITNWHYDSLNSALWYQVEAYEGSLPEGFLEDYWIFQNYTDNSEEEDTLLFVTIDPPVVDGDFSIKVEGMSVGSYAMEKYDQPLLEAKCNLSGKVSYRWQILAEEDLWVDIYDQNAKEMTVTYALAKSLLDNEDRVWFRCVAEANGQESISNSIQITALGADNDTFEPEEPTPEEPAPEDPVPEENLTPKSASEGEASEEPLPEETTSEDTTSEDTPSEGTTSEGTASEETTSEDTTSEDTASEETTSEGTTSEDTSSEEDLAPKSVSVDEATEEPDTTEVQFVLMKEASAEKRFAGVNDDASTQSEPADPAPTESTPVENEPAESEPTESAPEAAEEESDDTLSEIVLTAEDEGEDELDEQYILSIVYIYGDKSEKAGSAVAPTWSAEISPLQQYEATITSPEFPGYKPDQASVIFNYNVGELKSDIQITVYYNPADVAYTVLHRWQNINDDEYTDYETETLTGKTESQVPNDLHMEGGKSRYTGMEALPYALDTIAADGTTYIEIRYDRVYYLMTFDLDGGYGTLPIYARHGTVLSIPNPTKVGYTFLGWDGDGDGKVDATPTVMPTTNIEYKAIWKQDNTVKVSFVFWGEDAENDSEGNAKYSYYGSDEAYVKPGTTVNYLPGQNICGLEAHTHGSTCARECGLEEHTAHTDSCYDTTTPICGKAVHTAHTEACYTCGLTNHTHVRNCYSVTGGTLDDSATSNPGSVTHIGNNVYYRSSNGRYYLKIGSTYYRIRNYNSSSFSYSFTCGQTEHTHSNACGYKDEIHTHSIAQGCYQLTCTKPIHSHVAGCGEILCSKPEHAHGDTCRVTALDALSNTNLWTYNAEKTQKNVVVEDDGSTVVNVYFDRTKFKLNFSSSTSSNTPVIYTIEEKWGANIGNHFPIKGSNDITYDQGQRWSPQNSSTFSNVLVYIDIMPAENITFRLSTSTANTFIMHYMVETLPGETADRTYNGIGFTERTEVRARYNYITRAEDFIDLAGLDKLGSEPSFASNNQISYDSTSGGNVYFYYTRKNIDLTFHNGYEEIETVKAKYGYTLETYYNEDYEQAKPKNIDPGSIYFDGWYLNPECSDGYEVDLDTHTMPAEPLIVYAKWSEVVHTVRVWKIKNADGTFSDILKEDFRAPHNSLVQEEYIPETPEDEGHLKFVGWFYLDENGNEQAFDFATIPVTRDLTIYAKWRSEQIRDVTIRYVTEVAGVDVEIADRETFSGYVGDFKTYNAKIESQLYEGYQSKYYPTTASSSITISDVDANNVLTFRYVYKESPPYRVEYWIKDENGTLRPAFEKTSGGGYEFVGDTVIAESKMYCKEVTEHNLSVVTENYIPVAQYIPDQLQKRLILAADENENVIKFIYTYAPNYAIYVVHHYLLKPGVESPDSAADYDIVNREESTGVVGSTVTATPTAVFGANFNETLTVARMGANTWDTENNTMSAVLKNDNSTELNFYYTRVDCEYKVQYIDKDTGSTMTATLTKNAQYGEEVTETAKEFDGFTVDNDEIDYTIKLGTNVITFYYTRQVGDIQISKTIALDPKQLEENPALTLPDGAEDKKFEFTIEGAEKFHKGTFNYTITRKNGTTETGTVSVSNISTFKELGPIELSHGEKVVIHGLSLGTYTVKETHAVGYNTSIGTEAISQKTVTISTDGQKETLDFTNTYPFFTGDLYLSKKINKLDASDPDGTGQIFTYEIKVTPAAGTLEEERTITYPDLDAEGNAIEGSFTIPQGGYETVYSFDLRLKAGSNIVVKNIPEGDIRVMETVDETHYATPYYSIKYTKANPEQDATSGSSAIILSKIYGGHFTTVDYSNTYKKDNLTIRKNVTQTYPEDIWDGDTFTFRVTGETKLPDGSYTIEVGGQQKTATVADGKITLNIEPQITVTKDAENDQWSGQIEITKLPAGTYTVEEIDAAKGLDAYDTSPGSKKVEGLNLFGSTNLTANFTNTFKRTAGNLYVSKRIDIIPGSGVELDPNAEFSFTVVMPTDDAANNVDNFEGKTYTGTFTDRNGSDSTITFVVADGLLKQNATDDFSFKLKHNEHITISNLPIGEYTVQESLADGYASSFPDVGSNHVEENLTITTGNTAELNCVNTYPVHIGDLEFKKVVEKEYLKDQLPADEEYKLRVTLPEDSDAAGKTFVLVIDGASKNVVADANRIVEFSLTANQIAVLKDVPVGTCLVKEVLTAEQEGLYDISYTVNEELSNDETVAVTVVSGNTSHVICTNLYKKQRTNLTIDRTGSAADQDQVFIYQVKNTATNAVVTVTVVGNGETTIHDLPYGEYTVTQLNGWSWRYTDGAETVTLSAANNRDGQAAKVEFDNSPSTKWLDGFSQLIRNIRKGGAA